MFSVFLYESILVFAILFVAGFFTELHLATRKMTFKDIYFLYIPG